MDSTNVGSVLQPWEVPVAVPDMFKDGTQKIKVPNTSSVKVLGHGEALYKISLETLKKIRFWFSKI